MRTCDSCMKGEGVFHITLRMDVFGPDGLKVKLSTFWLCVGCERASRTVMARDAQLAQRTARRMTEEPGYLASHRELRLVRR